MKQMLQSMDPMTRKYPEIDGIGCLNKMLKINVAHLCPFSMPKWFYINTDNSGATALVQEARPTSGI